MRRVTRAVTVLVIACPHALGLAIPLVIAIATERAARAGVLVKDRLSLERMRTVDVVHFDKTGTLTKGEPAVSGGDSDVGLNHRRRLERSTAAPTQARPWLSGASQRPEREGPVTNDTPRCDLRRRWSVGRFAARVGLAGGA